MDNSEIDATGFRSGGIRRPWRRCSVGLHVGRVGGYDTAKLCLLLTFLFEELSSTDSIGLFLLLSLGTPVVRLSGHLGGTEGY